MSTTERNRKVNPNAARGQTRRDPAHGAIVAVSGAAAIKPHAFSVLRCLEDGGKLTRLIAGWRCPVCRRVTRDDVGSESGIVARVVVTGGGNG